MDVLTQNNNAYRTGANLEESLLSPSAVGKPGAFGKLFHMSVDADVYAQPLIVCGVQLKAGIRDLAVVATMANRYLSCLARRILSRAMGFGFMFLFLLGLGAGAGAIADAGWAQRQLK